MTNGFTKTIKSIVLNPGSFFLKNSGTKQTIAKNTFWLAIAEGMTRLLKLFLIIYVARILGATEYGKFTFALSFVSLFVIFSDLGISPITTRELARDKEKEKEFPNILSLKLLLSIGALALICLGSFFITPDPLVRGIIWILGTYVVLSSFLGIIYAFLQARQKMEYEALAKVIQAVVVTATGLFIIFHFPSIQNLSLAYLLSILIVSLSVLLFFHLKFYRLKLGFNRNIWRNVLLMSWPLALAGIFGTIYSNTDSVMMGYFNQITQVGWYNAAYKITSASLVLMVIISQSFYPALSKAMKDPKKRLQRLWHYYAGSMTALAIPLVAGGLALAPRIINFVYGSSYLPSVLAFQILIVMGGIAYLSNPLGQMLIVSDQQKKLFWVGLLGAVTNVVLNLILIPKYSLYGAAFASVLTYFLTFFALFIFLIKFTPIKRPFDFKYFSIFSIALVSCIPMYFAIMQPMICHLNVILTILIGGLIYLFFFLSLRKLVDLLHN